MHKVIAISLLALAFIWSFAFYLDVWNVDEYYDAVVAGILKRGGRVYVDTFSHRGPILPWIIEAVFALFGDKNMVAIRWVTFAIVVCLFFISIGMSREVYGAEHRYAVPVTFVCMTILPGLFELFALHSEWLAALFSAVGALGFLRWLKPGAKFGWAIASGAFYALAFFSKQTALMDFIPALAALPLAGIIVKADRKVAVRKGLWYLCLSASGFLAVSALFVVPYCLRDEWSYFQFGFVEYNLRYYVSRDFRQIRSFLTGFVHFDYGSFFLAFAIFFLAKRWARANATLTCFTVAPRVFIGCWGVTAIVATFLTGNEFAHYRIQLIVPFAAILPELLSLVRERMTVFAQRFAQMKHQDMRWFQSISIALAATVAVASHTLLAPRFKRTRETMTISERVGRYVRDHSKSEDTLQVWGFTPEVYFFAERPPASRFLVSTTLSGAVPGQCISAVDRSHYMVKSHQTELLQRLDSNKPKFFVSTAAGTRDACDFTGEYFLELTELLKREYDILNVPEFASNHEIRIYKRKGS